MPVVHIKVGPTIAQKKKHLVYQIKSNKLIVAMTVPKLFTPIRVGSIALKHRVVLAPLTRFRNTGDHVPNDLVVEHYKQRAGNGGGLLITEATLISPMAGGYPGAPGIYTQEQVEGWKKVLDSALTVLQSLPTAVIIALCLVQY
jgi:NADH:flavin oxidoreductase / NADH oxidase family